ATSTRVEVAGHARLLHRDDGGAADRHHGHCHQHLDGGVRADSANAGASEGAREGTGHRSAHGTCEKTRAMPFGGRSTLRIVPTGALPFIRCTRNSSGVPIGCKPSNTGPPVSE